ncbi:MAG: PqqD family protein [Clostridia bacterium]|nr:PqqD family protein [Clostridia bacterium]
MKIKKGYKLKTISGRHTIVADGKDVKDFNSVIVLNEIAVYLWNLMNNETTKEEMVEKLINELNLSKLLALSNVEIFVKTLKENDIIEM